MDDLTKTFLPFLVKANKGSQIPGSGSHLNIFFFQVSGLTLWVPDLESHCYSLGSQVPVPFLGVLGPIFPLCY